MGVIDWTGLGVIVSALAVAVTLAIFIVQTWRHDKEARARVQHDAVSRALTTMEASIRRQAIPFPFRAPASTELDFALLGARLAHELSADNRVIAKWVLGKTEAMRLAPSDRAALKIGVSMTAKLVEWNEGTVDKSWFRADIDKTVVSSAATARTKLLRRRASRTGQGMLTLAGAYGLFEIVRRTLVQLRSF
ncbi:hypothetical protein ACLRGF_06840 [Mycetocola zhadangensis]|uniref:hypothetical protein n=1 Tax=Mycetocola zhadangensis TaxID=1164595 RepID=UPI003A4DDE97